jgi:KaiC/GvpD/RAD55 family RecA-like ATPase
MQKTRVLTGIKGFDEICGGGLFRERSYLVVGSSGAGKTIFSLEYLYNGASKFNEPGIYLTTEEPPHMLREDAFDFGWNLEKLEDENKFAIIDGSSARIDIPSPEKYVEARPFDLQSLMDQLISLQKELNAKRVVVDSLTSLMYHIGSRARARVEFHRLTSTLRILGLTAILTHEIRNSPYEVDMENFLVDGVIVLYFRRILDKRIHSIEIFKMRGSPHSNQIHPFDITRDGINVKSEEGVFGEF